MQIVIETATDSVEHLRSLALMLLHLVGDLKEDKPAASQTPLVVDREAFLRSNAHGTTQSIEGRVQTDKIEVGAARFVPPPPPPPPPIDAELDVDTEGDPVGPVGNFIPPPPPPPPIPLAPAPSSATAPAATSAAQGAANVSTLPNTGAADTALEYDKSGMPWDERIHQAGKSRKADGTWKIKKGINEKSPGLLEAVVKELASRKPLAFSVDTAPAVGSVPPPPPAGAVPPPPPAGAVPPPPSPTDNVPPATGPTFRTLVDKVTTASKLGTITPGAVSAIVQGFGAPNLQALVNMPHLIGDVDAAVDAAILGY